MKKSRIRLLAISDIDGDLACVRKFVEQVRRLRFDALLVAGDIGEERREDSCSPVFRLLERLRRPVIYVLGNHDRFVAYDTSFSPRASQLHSNVIPIGDFHLIGFSGSHPHWGRNPFSRNSSLRGKGPGTASRMIRDWNVQDLVDVMRRSKVNPRRCVFLSHDRCYGLHKFFDAAVPLVNIHGHFGTASQRVHEGVAYINVSKLREIRPVVRRRGSRRQLFVHAGCFTSITISGDEVKSKRIALKIDWERYEKTADDGRLPGCPDDWDLGMVWSSPRRLIDWVPEDRRYQRPLDGEAT